MKFQEKYARPKDQKWGNKAGFKDGRAVPQLALSLKLKGQKCSTLSGVLCTASSIWRREKKNIPYVVVVHRLWQDLLAEFLKRTADLKETKNSPPPLVVLAFMDLYVCMWKLCMLIGKLWCFRWNCWINSQWKEARRIQSGESFRSSQVRVKHMSWHPLQTYKRTCTKGK